MIQAKNMLCAETIIVDRESNAVSIINLLEDINSIGFPLFIPKLSILNIFERIEADNGNITNYKLVITINNKELINAPYHIQFMNLLRTRNIMNIQGLALPEPGLLEIKILNETNTELIKIQFDVKHQPQVVVPQTNVSQ